MTIPTLSTLPVAPARTDPPATFVTRADAFLAAIVTFQGEMNTSIGAMNTDIAGVNANAISAAADAASASSDAISAGTSETNAQIYAAAAQAAAGVPSLAGNALKKLSVNAAEDGVEWVEVQSDPTLGTLTKTFTTDESSTISLTSSVLAPVVSVTKEVPQTGVTNNNWDVSSTTENYTRLDSAAATTLDWVGDLSSASFVDSFSVSGQETSPRGLAFNTNGTKMFVLGIAGLDVNEYTLSTGFDVSTASFVDSFSVSGQDTSPWGLSFNSDGTKMYVTGITGVDVNEYLLSTAFDVSTASYSQNYSLSAQTATPRGISFNLNGTKMFIADYSSSAIDEYLLSTAFDVSTASYTQAFSVSSQETQPLDVAFNSNGTVMFVVGNNSDNVNNYSLSTAFDISTASFIESLDVSSQDTNPSSLAFNQDGSKMFVAGYASDNVNEYTLPFALALGTGSFASADVGKTIEANSGAFVLTAADGSFVETTAPTSYAQVASGDWSMYGVVYNATDGDLELSGYTTAFDISNGSFETEISVNSQDTAPDGIAFNSDGTKMFILGQTGDDVNEYTLSTAFNVSTASYSQNFSISAQDTIPKDITFNNDGTKMFILGEAGDDVNEYNLSTGFDISTSVYSQNFYIGAKDLSAEGIAFNNDGTKLFLVGGNSDTIYEYTLSTGFDISTTSFVSSFSVTAQESYPRGIAFNNLGTEMFIIGTGSDSVNKYTLSTAFDLSTASFSGVSFSVVAQDNFPVGIAFSTDGSKMFMIGQQSNKVAQYDVGSIVYTTGYHPVHTTSSIDSTYWTDINSMTADQNAGSGNVYYAISTDDRTTWTVIDNTDGERDIVRNNSGTWQYNSNGTYASQTWVNGTTNTELATLAEAMEGAEGNPDLANAVFSNSFSVSSQDSTPAGVCFNTTGTKMFVVGGTSPDSVYEYTLSIAFNVATSSFVDSFDVSSQDIRAKAIAFNANGTKMFVVGSTNDSVFEYNLSASFDVSSASYSQSFSVASQETDPQGLAFNTNGTKMFVVGSINDSVFEYNLSSGFDISSASYSQGFSVSAKEGSTTGVAFNTDGTQMFVVGNSSDAVHQYNLSTGFDVSSAVFSKSFSVSSQDIDPQDITFSADGSKMFIVGETNASVYQYALTSYTNQMDKTQLDAVTDPNHIALGNDLDLAIVFNMTSGSTVPSSDGVAINYDANVLNKGAVLGTDYDFDAPAQNSVRITALAANNLKVRVV